MHLRNEPANEAAAQSAANATTYATTIATTNATTNATTSASIQASAGSTGRGGAAQGSGDDGRSGFVPNKSEVALFVTCLADLMRPSVARASMQLLLAAGCRVVVPKAQTCCGQPGYNNGDFANARAIAKQTIELFEPYDFTVLPSGSCAGMLVEHYPKLLTGTWRTRAQTFAGRVYELTSFLSEVCHFAPEQNPRISNANAAALAYHDSCAGLRELGIREQPRQLLSRAGIAVRELDQRDVCCGFGGTFCAKMPAISAKMADDKLDDLERSGSDTLIGGDLGCLLALAGRASRRNLPFKFQHIAEVLADSLDPEANNVSAQY